MDIAVGDVPKNTLSQSLVPFTTSVDAFRLNPSESKSVTLLFEPTKLGRQQSTLTVSTSAGDDISIPLSGNVGMPFVFFTESEADSCGSMDALARERNVLMTKWAKKQAGQSVEFSATEQLFIDHFEAAPQSDVSTLSRPVLDLGIVEFDGTKRYRRLISVINSML